MTTRILLAGFAPFAGQSLNASAEVVGALRGEVRETVVLPVVYGRATDALLAAMERLELTAVLLLGQADGAAEIRLERLARNFVTSREPDEEGIAAFGDPVVTDGPATYETALPLEAIAARLTAAGIPAVESGDAGGYVCNYTFYGLMHRLADERPQIAGGLVHVPCLPEQVTDAPAMPRATQERAVREVLAVVAEI